MNLRKARFAVAGLAVTLILASAIATRGAAIPQLRGRVNDYAQLWPPDRARALESRLEQFEQETGHQVAILTIPTLEGEDIEGFSIRVADNWKIGKKDFDNGVIFTIAAQERKLRIEVGYGLEGVLPDAIANRIIQEVIVPRFRNGDYPGGIEAGTNAILQVIKGEQLPPGARASRQPGSSQFGSISILMITAMIALFIGMTRRRVLGGALGGTAAGFGAALFSGGGFGLVFILALIVGALLGTIGSTMSVAAAGSQWTAGSRRRARGGGIFPGGFGSGGGFGGGGFGGGGFGGGGGGFGGGGASGGW